eukprot:TRINITY_DN23848_c0_g1_i1.p1 TRINITY_DN23848_c0_g1~~TRINITY_DN23848_c0_g1_i1.p1  ORF type:complete len:193 (+),score=17.64 TRINITY_DN23848_c0_g1_i1:141-719(+)
MSFFFFFFFFFFFYVCKDRQKTFQTKLVFQLSSIISQLLSLLSHQNLKQLFEIFENQLVAEDFRLNGFEFSSLQSQIGLQMNRDKFVFAQLVSFLDRNKFNYIVRKYEGDKYVKHFTCWNQILALMFGQLSNRESLRDLIVALDAHHSKCYHLGMGKNVSKSSLARANQDRDCRIFEEFAYFLVNEAPCTLR